MNFIPIEFTNGQVKSSRISHEELVSSYMTSGGVLSLLGDKKLSERKTNDLSCGEQMFRYVKTMAPLLKDESGHAIFKTPFGNLVFYCFDVGVDEVWLMQRATIPTFEECLKNPEASGLYFTSFHEEEKPMSPHTPPNEPRYHVHEIEKLVIRAIDDKSREHAGILLGSLLRDAKQSSGSMNQQDLQGVVASLKDRVRALGTDANLKEQANAANALMKAVESALSKLDTLEAIPSQPAPKRPTPAIAGTGRLFLSPVDRSAKIHARVEKALNGANRVIANAETPKRRGRKPNPLKVVVVKTPKLKEGFVSRKAMLSMARAAGVDAYFKPLWQGLEQLAAQEEKQADNTVKFATDYGDFRMGYFRNGSMKGWHLAPESVEPLIEVLTTLRQQITVVSSEEELPPKPQNDGFLSPSSIRQHFSALNANTPRYIAVNSLLEDLFAKAEAQDKPKGELVNVPTEHGDVHLRYSEKGQKSVWRIDPACVPALESLLPQLKSTQRGPATPKAEKPATPVKPESYFSFNTFCADNRLFGKPNFQELRSIWNDWTQQAENSPRNADGTVVLTTEKGDVRLGYFLSAKRHGWYMDEAAANILLSLAPPITYPAKPDDVLGLGDINKLPGITERMYQAIADEWHHNWTRQAKEKMRETGEAKVTVDSAHGPIVIGFYAVGNKPHAYMHPESIPTILEFARHVPVPERKQPSARVSTPAERQGSLFKSSPEQRLAILDRNRAWQLRGRDGGTNDAAVAIVAVSPNAEARQAFDTAWQGFSTIAKEISLQTEILNDPIAMLTRSPQQMEPLFHEVSAKAAYYNDQVQNALGQALGQLQGAHRQYYASKGELQQRQVG